MKTVFDTSIFIDYLRGGTISDEVFDQIEKQNAQLFIPTIVIFELFSGNSTKNSSVRIKITNMIQSFKRIELTEEIAMMAGKLYREIGKQVSTQDYIIAASALSIGASVLTLNQKHFQQIPGLDLYKI
ncbi:type II toxin-antitoxin system VapC family toxin [Candidatus Microgenomates bacterium]|nr:type II toxin-antitoxin system VapC family toxin [Candidatus Microgenomates bacterium]